MSCCCPGGVQAGSAGGAILSGTISGAPGFASQGAVVSAVSDASLPVSEASVLGEFDLSKMSKFSKLILVLAAVGGAAYFAYHGFRERKNARIR